MTLFVSQNLGYPNFNLMTYILYVRWPLQGKNHPPAHVREETTFCTVDARHVAEDPSWLGLLADFAAEARAGRGVRSPQAGGTAFPARTGAGGDGVTTGPARGTCVVCTRPQ